MNVRFTTAAGGDRRNAEEYYGEISPAVVASFRRALDSALRYIASFPEGAPRTHKNVRAKTVAGFPYSVLYVVRETTISVLAIAHHARHPETFRQRR